MKFLQYLFTFIFIIGLFLLMIGVAGSHGHFRFRPHMDSGIIYFVETNGQTWTAYGDHKVKWKANVLESCPKPEVGKPEIRYIKLTGDKIEITLANTTTQS